jgi:hypothetical protein
MGETDGHQSSVVDSQRPAGRGAHVAAGHISIWTRTPRDTTRVFLFFLTAAAAPPSRG